jgi:hypothetical protein
MFLKSRHITRCRIEKKNRCSCTCQLNAFCSYSKMVPDPSYFLMTVCLFYWVITCNDDGIAFVKVRKSAVNDVNRSRFLYRCIACQVFDCIRLQFFFFAGTTLPGTILLGTTLPGANVSYQQSLSELFFFFQGK